MNRRRPGRGLSHARRGDAHRLSEILPWLKLDRRGLADYNNGMIFAPLFVYSLRIWGRQMTMIRRAFLSAGGDA